MYRTLFVLLALTTVATHPMDQFKDRVKEKLHNAADRVAASFNKDAVTNMVSSIGSFFNKGMNRLVDATIYNDNYTTKEKITVSAGTVSCIGIFFAGKSLIRKNSTLKAITDTNKNKKQYLDQQIKMLSDSIDLEYTMNGVFNNLCSKNISSYLDFLKSLDDIHDEMQNFVPAHHLKNQAFISMCQKQINHEAIHILNFLNRESNNYKDVIKSLHSKWSLRFLEDSTNRREFKEQLDEMEFAVKHKPVTQTNQA